MYVTKFCRAPSGNWVGVVEYQGGHIFSAGRTLDDLLKRMKNNVYTTTKGQVSNRQVYIDTKQHDTYEFEKLYKVFMSNMFVSKFWRAKGKEQEPETHVVTAPLKAPSSYEYITDMDGDEMVVYKLVEVARYKLHGATIKSDEPVVNSDPEIPVLQGCSESQEENL